MMSMGLTIMQRTLSSLYTALKVARYVIVMDAGQDVPIVVHDHLVAMTTADEG